MDSTGERWIPGTSDPRIEADHLERYRFARQFIAGRKVLDIACGSGAGSHWMIEHGRAASVLGVDIDDEAIDYARAHFKHPHLHYEVGDVERGPTDDGFDVIVCFETIEHIHDDVAAMRTLHRVMSAHGILLLSTPNRTVVSPRNDTLADKPDNPFHVREYLVAELASVVRKAGFEIDAFNGQRFRVHFPRGSLNATADVLRRTMGRRPDFDSSPEVTRSRWPLHQPRYWLLVCRKAGAT